MLDGGGSEMAMRRVLVAGLAAMAGVALVSAIWPSVADAVFGVLVVELSAVIAVLGSLVVRRVRVEVAWRRELRTMPQVDGTAYGAAPAAPSLSELRQSA